MMRIQPASVNAKVKAMVSLPVKDSTSFSINGIPTNISKEITILLIDNLEIGCVKISPLKEGNFFSFIKYDK